MHFVLITLNSLINPFVYALRLPVLNKAMRKLLGTLLFWKRGAVAPETSPGGEITSATHTK